MTTVSRFSILRIPCGMQLLTLQFLNQGVIISILRIPCGMQRKLIIKFQSYASSTGCNHSSLQTMQMRHCHFNLTHPLRDATERQQQPEQPQHHFNLTHPLRDATLIFPLKVPIYVLFQSYAPLVGCNLVYPVYISTLRAVSILRTPCGMQLSNYRN